jgi:hypothetical protein
VVLFGIQFDDKLKVAIQDGREYWAQQNPTGKNDLIIVDAAPTAMPRGLLLIFSINSLFSAIQATAAELEQLTSKQNLPK